MKPPRREDETCPLRKLRGRPPVITSESMLAIAREVFLERGIRATTAEVAERASISEGTIFHRFKSKDALFRAAMQFDPEKIPEPLATLPEAGKGDLRRTLLDVGTRMLALGRVAVPMMMMSWSNPTGEYSLTKLITKPHGYRQAFLKLRTFFADEVAAGRLCADPEALTRIFMGSLHHFCMTELFFSPEQANQTPGRPDPLAYVESLVDLLLRGASPRDAASANAPAQSEANAPARRAEPRKPRSR